MSFVMLYMCVNPYSKKKSFLLYTVDAIDCYMSEGEIR